jgi:hypothetical protein
MIANYFDGNLSGKYTEAAWELFLSLTKECDIVAGWCEAPCTDG